MKADKPKKSKVKKPIKKKTLQKSGIDTTRSEHGLFGEGNQFWQIRSRHGRKRLFETPQEMAEAICEYFQWCTDNPLIEIVPFHSQGVVTLANVPKLRVYTIQGLCHYLDCNVKYFTDFENSLEGKTDKISADFSLVIARAREIIYQQKYTGAVAGFFNPFIVTRDLGLTDKSETSVSVSNKQSIADGFAKLFAPDESES